MPGVVLLDVASFDKTVKKFPFAFVYIGDGSTIKTTTDKKSEFGKLWSGFKKFGPKIMVLYIRARLEVLV
jgi:hypothetical protein